MKGCNWGCALNKSGIICVDVDTKPGKDGQLTYDVLDLWEGWPQTFTVRTPSGGKHCYYTGPHTFALGEHGFGEGVDSPNYTLIPGCTLPNGRYEIVNNMAMQPAPQWMLDLLQRKQTERRTLEPGVTRDHLSQPVCPSARRAQEKAA